MQWMAVGEPSRALDALEHCVKARTTYLCFTAQNPYFRPLHGDPRFQRILRTLKLDGRIGAVVPWLPSMWLPASERPGCVQARSFTMKVRSPSRRSALGRAAARSRRQVFSSTNANAADPVRSARVLPFSGGVELYGAQAKLGLDLRRPTSMPPAGSSDVPSRSSIATTDPAEHRRRGGAQDGRGGRCLAVVGPITSQNLDAIVPVLASRKTPLLYATNYEGGKCNRYMFSFNTVPNQELDSLLPYMTRPSAPTTSCSAPIATGRIACSTPPSR